MTIHFIATRSLIASLTLFATVFVSTSATAGVWSRARGEARVLHSAAKTIFDRVQHLDTMGSATLVSEQLVATTCNVKDLVYADADWSSIDLGLRQIGQLNDALIINVQSNPTLLTDKRTVRSIEVFQDRYVNLRRDLLKALEIAQRNSPYTVGRTPICITGVPNAQVPFSQNARGNSGPFGQVPFGRRDFNPSVVIPSTAGPRRGVEHIEPRQSSYVPRYQTHPTFRNNSQRTLPGNTQFAPASRSYRPQIEVRSNPRTDVKTELVRMLLTRVLN
jgi:hypothetical protein